MDALFIGHAYIDVTFLTDHFPTGDEKTIGKGYALSFGGNATAAAYACAKLGRPARTGVDLMTPIGEDWLAALHMNMAKSARIRLFVRPVKQSALSLVLPNGTKRAIVRCRDADYLAPFPEVDISRYKVLHLDGHMPDAALFYAKKARAAGVPTSLDGGTVRPGFTEALPDAHGEGGGGPGLLDYIDYPVVSELFCEKWGGTADEVTQALIGRGAKMAAVTMGADGVYWREAADGAKGEGPLHHLPALRVPTEEIVDTNGAGDIFHGAYIHSLIAHPDWTWRQHFNFSRATSALSIRQLGIEASLPDVGDVEALVGENPV